MRQPPMVSFMNTTLTSLDLTITEIRFENWTRGPATIIEAVAEIVQFIPKFYVRVDGISMPDCRALEKRFGPNFPALIEADQDIPARRRGRTRGAGPVHSFTLLSVGSFPDLRTDPQKKPSKLEGVSELAAPATNWHEHGVASNGYLNAVDTILLFSN